MKHDLKQQIAQLILQGGPIAILDRAGNLICFLDRVRRDGREALLAVPGAPGPRIAQPPHDLKQVVNLGIGHFYALAGPGLVSQGCSPLIAPTAHI